MQDVAPSTPYALAMSGLLGFKGGWVQFLLNPEDPELQKDLGVKSSKDEGIEYLFLCISLGTALGACICGILADSLGRRKVSFVGEVISLAGVVCTLVLPTKTLYFGRLVSGLGMGVCLVSKALYQAELAGPNVRGFVMGLTSFTMGLSALLEKIFIDGGKAPVSWRVKIGLAAIPVLALLSVIYAAPESPFWRMRIAGEMKDDLTEPLNPKAPSDKPAATSEGGSWFGRFTECFKQKRAMGCTVLLIFSAVLPGFHLLVNLSGEMLKHIVKPPHTLGIDTYWAVVLIVGCSALGGMLSTVCADRVGRRPLVHTANAGAVILLMAAGILNWRDRGSDPTASFVLLCCLSLVQCLGAASLTGCLVTELFDTPLRAAAVTMMFVVMFASIGGAVVLMPYLFDEIGIGKTLVIVSSVRFLLAVPLFMLLPETAKTTLDEHHGPADEKAGL